MHGIQNTCSWVVQVQVATVEVTPVPGFSGYIFLRNSDYYHIKVPWVSS